MKTNEETVGLLIGKGNAITRDICQSLGKKGISAIVVQKEAAAPEADDAPHHWSGQPDKDMFFNGWKLLF